MVLEPADAVGVDRFVALLDGIFVEDVTAVFPDKSLEVHFSIAFQIYIKKWFFIRTNFYNIRHLLSFISLTTNLSITSNLSYKTFHRRWTRPPCYFKVHAFFL